MNLLRIDVDLGGALARQLTAIELDNLPFAARQAANATAVEIRETWARKSGTVFDRPTPLTSKAAQYEKATKSKPFATIKLRDEAAKGNPPSRYLAAQVMGGERGHKGMERLLEYAGIMPRGMFAVPGNSVNLDQFGNVGSGQVRKIISQLQAGREAGYTSNESETTRNRRLSRQRKRGGGGSYFAVTQKRGRMRPGVYERISFASGTAYRSVFIFVDRVTYKPRYDIFGMAEKRWQAVMPFFFERELAKAVENSRLRGRT